MVLQNSKEPAQVVHIKQRIIGAIVLVSLGVIFIPMLLNSERSLDDGMPVFGSNIPDKPEYNSKKPKVSQPSSTAAVIIKSQADFDSRIIINEKSPKASTDSKKFPATSPAKVDKNKSASKKTGTAKQSATKTSVNNKIITAKTITSANKTVKAWAVQVGSFSDRKNAFSLRNKLRRKKFTAFVESVKTSKGNVYRVRVGPEIRRVQAEKTRKKLMSQLKLKGLVIAHP